MLPTACAQVVRRGNAAIQEIVVAARNDAATDRADCHLRPGRTRMFLAPALCNGFGHTIDNGNTSLITVMAAASGPRSASMWRGWRNNCTVPRGSRCRHGCPLRRAQQADETSALRLDVTHRALF